MKRPCLALLLVVASCSGDEEKGSDLAAPVTAPMRLREHMMRDVNKQKDKAKEREAQFDSLLQQER